MKTKKQREKSATETPPVMCQHTRMADIADLKPHPQNPNKHSDEQVALLAKNIRHLGWRHPIIVSKRTGFIVAGHARLQAAQVLNLASVPVDEQDFASETEERAYLIADNRIAELAEIQNAAIKDLLQELDTGEIDMDLTGYTENAIEELMMQTHRCDDGQGLGEGGSSYQEQYGVIVICRDQAEQEKVYNELAESGYTVKVVAT